MTPKLNLSLLSVLSGSILSATEPCRRTYCKDGEIHITVLRQREDK